MLDEAGEILEHNQRFAVLLTQHGDAVLLAAANAVRDDRGEFQLIVTAGHEQLDVKGQRLSSARGTTETFLLVRDVTHAREIEERDRIIRTDLERAAKFQRSILGKPPKVTGVQFGIAYEPLDAVGGDVYDAAVLPSGILRLFIADATGHGIEAALSTILIKNEYDAIKRHGASPAASLRELNNRIAANHHNVEAMFSCAIVDLDLARNKLQYANAGHPGPLLVRGGDVEILEEDGALVGIKPGLRFPEWNVDLDAWEACVLVTDGITESRNLLGKEFGTERLYGAIRKARESGRGITDEIVMQVTTHRGKAPRRDDLTAFAVERTSVMTRP